MKGEAVVTSALLWRGALIAAVIDIPLLALAAKGVPAALFARLGWYLGASAAVVYVVIWGVVASGVYWDQVYGHLFPAWARWWLPLVYGAAYGGTALLFWSASRRAGRWPALWFCLLGGLVSVPGHAWGIGRGLLTVPLLEQASMASALVFGVFEFIVYWCVILWLAVLVRALIRGSFGGGAG